MVRTSFAGTIMLVEGPSDCKLFRPFVDEAECTLLPGWGKERTLDAITILDTEPDFVGFLAVVDADFWHVDGVTPSSDNVLVTEVHDVEVMIVVSEAFDHFEAEHCSPTKVDRFVAGDRHLRDVILDKALAIGALRYISHRDGLRLTFHGLKHRKVVNRETLEVDVRQLANNVLALTGSTPKTVDELQELLNDFLAGGTQDPHQHCCGEDVVAVISIGLRKALATKDAKVASPKNVGIALRHVFDSRDLAATALYQASRLWEERNQPFRVFHNLAPPS